MNSRPPWRTVAPAAGVALFAVLAGCGGGADADGSKSPSETTTVEVRSDAPDHEPSGSEPAADFDDIGAVTVEEPAKPHLVDDRVRAEADALRRAVEKAASEQPWRDEAGAVAAGYVPMPGDPLHWYDPEAVSAGGAIDPARPDFLMIEEGRVLGVMFLAPSDDGQTDPPPTPGAPLVRWHLHRWSEPVCLGIGGLVVSGVPADDGTCPTDQEAATSSPWMFHVWLVGDDPFAAEMHPPGHDH